MTVLLYDYFELEERSARHLKVWKVWHTILYVFAAVFGIMNYIFLHRTMELVDGNCILYPRELEFHEVELPIDLYHNKNGTRNAETNEVKGNLTMPITTVKSTDVVNNDAQTDAPVLNNAQNDTNEEIKNNTVIGGGKNETIIEGKTQRMMLDTSRTLFGQSRHCQFAEYMPIMSTILAIVWITLFTMCPSGGRSRSGLQQPWRILTPALVLALILVGLTGHSFTTTNGGLQTFCAAFQNITNATTCSSINPHIELGWNSSWGMGGRAAATRAASAGVWASWACAAALLLARCLAAPDFRVRRTGVYLTKDPGQKILPYLKKSPRRSPRSSPKSPTLRDTISVKSEPTITTELVTVSVEQGQESAPTSLMATPRHDHRRDMLEMTHTPHELNYQR